jgi:hypothetical protein
VRDSGNVESEPVSIDFGQGRPTTGPAGEPSYQRRIAIGVGRHRNQGRVERSRIGEPDAGLRTAFGSGLGHGMDEKPMRPLDCQNDRRVRR